MSETTETKPTVSEIVDESSRRLKQEVEGEGQENLERIVRQFRSRVAKTCWKVAQKWSKWEKEGPVLMPDYTRIYYRKGKSEIAVMEYPPQVRILKFKGALALRENSTTTIDSESSDKVVHYSLALPYVVFLFRFTDGIFSEVRVAFSDRPLKTLKEKPLRPFLSNIDSNLVVCLGLSFDKSELEEGNIAQQTAFVLSHFWHTVYSDEWSGHFWQNMTHFQNNDPRMKSLEDWQEASVENPLFVIEDVNWMNHSEECFGDIVVRMLENEKENIVLHEELYNELVDEFLDELKNNMSEIVQNSSTTVFEQLKERLTKEFENV